MTQLSLCMIVKNEEATLPDCLASVGDLCDEIVIVDTGSTDQTVAVARGLGAKVLHAEWTDDFAAARNVAIAAANGEWILQLDADERLATIDSSSLRDALNDPEVAAWNLAIESALPSGGTAIHYFPRLVRRTHDLRYHGRVHERPIFEGRTSVATFRILHSGYDSTPKEIARKQERNLALLERWIEDEPDNPEPLFHQSTSLLAAERYEEAVPVTRRAAYAFASRGESGRSTQAATWNLHGIAHAGRRDWRAAIAAQERSIALDADLVDAYFDLALCREATGDYEAALSCYEAYHGARARWIASKRTDLMLRTVANDSIARHNTGVILERIGRTELAAAEFRAAVESQPGLVAARRALARVTGAAAT